MSVYRPGMLHWVRSRLEHLTAPLPELSRVIVGSTGSGKSEGELIELVQLADRRDHAIVLLDGHGPLAFRAVGHWAARGHEPRLVYEPLNATDRVLGWEMLPRSAASDPSRRLIEEAEIRDELVQCFLAQRNIATLADKPWTKEWLEAAITLGLAQPGPEPLPSLLDAFRIGTPSYERLLRESHRPELVDKFRNLERLRRKNEVQYETLTGASRRLLELVCTSEVVRLRSRTGSFDWLGALRDRRLIAFDGGAVRSRELKRTLFLLVSMQVIHGVRHHFAQTQRPLPVVLVLEEAGALGLVTPFVLGAMQELRKAGLSIHLLTQSCLDFGDRAVFESILANAPWQCWYQVLSPADQELGARVLANAEFDPLAIHFTRTRPPQVGGSGVRSTLVTEEYYQTPHLQEQQWRMRLATLRIGERLVRDRQGVTRERVRMLRSPLLRGGFEDGTRNVIDRIRHQPIYLHLPAEPSPTTTSFPDAATRLRNEMQRE